MKIFSLREKQIDLSEQGSAGQMSYEIRKSRFEIRF